MTIERMMEAGTANMMAEEQARAGKWMTKEVMTTDVEQLSTIESNSL